MSGRRRSPRLTFVVLAAVLCLGPLTAVAGGNEAPSGRSNRDPLERMNRGIFWFNEQVDGYVLEPVAKGWDWVAPDRVQRSVSNFFANLHFPIVALNNLLQGKMRRGASDIGRFAVNTTVGVLGFFDPASRWGLPQHEEDFGQTLGYWGVPPGPYLVLPILGPSNPRDGLGLVADSLASIYPIFVATPITMGASSVEVINFRSQVIDEVRQVKHAALDYYVFVRNAYAQRRKALVNDRTEMSMEERDDLYYEDFDNEE